MIICQKVEAAEKAEAATGPARLGIRLAVDAGTRHPVAGRGSLRLAGLDRLKVWTSPVPQVLLVAGIMWTGSHAAVELVVWFA